MLFALYALATAGYGAAWLQAVQRIGLASEQARNQHVEPPRSRILQGALLLALVCHGIALVHPLLDNGTGTMRFGFAQALSAALWLAVLLLWLESLSVRIESLGLLVLPLVVLSMWLPAFFPGGDISALSNRPFFAPHLAVALMGYSVLTVAALHAVLMTVAERTLHDAGDNTAPWLRRWLDSLPPLLALERALFRLIAIGFVLLTLTVASGVVFGEEIFGQALRFDHKTVFTLIAWAVFGILLIGRSLWGWRGRTALRLTLSGFGLLLLAYVGSRFVLEVILHRV